MKSVSRKIERRAGSSHIRFKNIVYLISDSFLKGHETAYRTEVPIKNGIPDPSMFTPVAEASYYKKKPLPGYRSATRDYRKRDTNPQAISTPMAVPTPAPLSRNEKVFKVLASVAMVALCWPLTAAVIWMAASINSTPFLDYKNSASFTESGLTSSYDEGFYTSTPLSTSHFSTRLSARSVTVTADQLLDQLLADVINNAGGEQ